MSVSSATNINYPSISSLAISSANSDDPIVSVSTANVGEIPSSMNDAATGVDDRQMQPGVQEEDLSLPSHMERKTNPNGRVYYVNHKTRKTSWWNPLSNDEDSPSRIERKIGEKGRSYYANHETKTTSWLNPVMIDKAKAIENPELRKRKEWVSDMTKVYVVDYEKNKVSEPETYDGDLPKEGAWVE